MTAYATIEQALLTFQQPPANEERLARLAFLLDQSADELNRAAERDWFRYPAVTEEEPEPVTWYAAGDGRSILHVHGGVVSLTSLAVRWSVTAEYEAIDAAGYALRGVDPDSDEPGPPGFPSFHIVLTGATAHGAFPRGIQSVRLTGVRGWDTPPAPLVEANIERARQLYSADASFSGAPIGSDEYGSPAVTIPRLPTVFWEFLKVERSRFVGCHL